MVAPLNDKFFWCIGIEDTFIPQAGPGARSLDEYELTQHYERWREDFDLLPELGVSHIRWGVPWYKVNPKPGVYDWSWLDQVLDYLVNRLNVQPIVDLMHYGTPLWLDNSFINASYPQRVAEYAAAFASRYKDLVRYYTPLNEPTVNADWCGRMAQWPPHLNGDDGYVKVLMQVARGMVLTSLAIRDADSDAVLIQVEALGKAWSAEPQLAGAVRDWREHRYLALDLLTGCFSEDYVLWNFLKSHGVQGQEIQWFRDNGVKPDVLGVNYYPVSGGELVMDAAGSPTLKVGLAASDLTEVLREAWSRYHIPLMVTETAAVGSLAERAQWMDDTVAIVRAEQGLPIVGYTWWPLFDMVEWTYRWGDQPLEHYMLRNGLWDLVPAENGQLNRSRNELADRYRQYIYGQR